MERTLERRALVSENRELRSQLELRHRLDGLEGDIDQVTIVRDNTIDVTARGYEVGLDYRPLSRLLLAGQHPNKVKVACAREMVGFVWESLNRAAA